MATTHTSQRHVFDVDDVTGSSLGEAADINFAAGPEEVFIDKSNNTLFPVDSTFGFYTRDFVGAEEKVFDGDYAEGWVGNLDFGFPDDPDPLPPGWVSIEEGLGVRNAKTDFFLTGPNNLGTWGIGLGTQATVKQSTEHYATMAALLSDQAFPGDPDALGPLDNDLRVLDYQVDDLGNITNDPLHLLWANELAQALQAAIDNVNDNGPAASDVILGDIDFDRDGSNDVYRITTDTVQFEGNTVTVGAVDLGNDASIDLVDRVLNGYGNDADITDVLAPNEASVTSDIAFSASYSVTVKDDGKLLYRWGEGVKRPNDIRMEVNLDLPDEWTQDNGGEAGVADGLEGDGFTVTRAELVIRHNITNNPNDQVRPEDYENEAAIGRLPAHYIIQDPDNVGNELWVSPVDSFDGAGKPLPSYLVLDAGGNVINTVSAPAGSSTPVFDPDGVRVGWRNDSIDNGTILKDGLLAQANMDADLVFASADLEEGYTVAWYTTVNREPFEWSYDTNDSPYINVFESFRSPEEAADAGFSSDDLVSGPRWRLTPNKFGQDLPGLEVPLTPDTAPPYTNANIKYETGEYITTTLNLLDWKDGASPLNSSLGWMSVNMDEVDSDSDGRIDEGWTGVNGTLGAGDALPDLILTATSPNGVKLQPDFLDTAVYVKGDRQDDARLFDIQLELEYDGGTTPSDGPIGTVQLLNGVNHVEQTVSFLDGTSLNEQVVFVTPPTYRGWDVGSITVSETTSTSATLRFQEADYLNDVHGNAETVAMLALEEGRHTLSDGSELEVGTVNVAAGSVRDFQTVSFTDAFDEAPVVLLQLQTDNGEDWAIARTRGVTATGFEFALQEEEASDGLHDAEILGWMALDSAAADGLVDWGGVDAQAFAVDGIDHEGGSFTFDAALGLSPLVSASIGTDRGWDPVTLRLKSLPTNDGTQASAEFFVQEDQSLDAETRHFEEVVYGVGFEQEAVLWDAPDAMPSVVSDGMEMA